MALNEPVVLSPAIWRAVAFAHLTTVDITSATWDSPQRQLVRRYQLTYQNNAWNTVTYLTAILLVGECPSGAITEDSSTSTLPQNLACSQPQMQQLRHYTYTRDTPADANRRPTIQQLTNIEAPQWGPWIEHTGQPAPLGIAFLDINGDGRADLVFGPFDKNYDTRLNGSHGPWSLYTLLSPLPGGAVGSATPLSLSPQNPPGLVATIGDDLFPNASRIVYGDWLSDGNLSWLWMNIQPGTSTFSTDEIYTPTNSGLLGVRGGLGGYTGSVPDWRNGRAFDVDGDGLPDMGLVPDPDVKQNPPQWTYLTIRDHQGNTQPFGFKVGPSPFNKAMDPSLYSTNSSPQHRGR